MDTTDAAAIDGANTFRATEWGGFQAAIGPVRLDVRERIVALAFQCVDGTYAFVVRTVDRITADGGHATLDCAKDKADAVLAESGYAWS